MFRFSWCGYLWRAYWGVPVSNVHLPEGVFQVSHPLGLWRRFSGVVKRTVRIWLVNYLHVCPQSPNPLLGLAHRINL